MIILSIFSLWTFPFICIKIPAAPAPAYGLYIVSLSWYDILEHVVLGSKENFLDRGLLLLRNLVNQWIKRVKLKSTLRMFYGGHHDLVNYTCIPVTQMITDLFSLLYSQSCHFFFYDWSSHYCKFNSKSSRFQLPVVMSATILVRIKKMCCLSLLSFIYSRVHVVPM